MVFHVSQWKAVHAMVAETAGGRRRSESVLRTAREAVGGAHGKHHLHHQVLGGPTLGYRLTYHCCISVG
jgi:hypothetical protein